MSRTLPIRLRTIAAGIVVIASGLIIWNAYQSIIGSSDVTDATLPIIKADLSPFRVVPENPGGAEIPNQGSTIYNVLDVENPDDMALDGVNIDREPETLMEVSDVPTAGFELPELPENRTESLYGILNDLKDDEPEVAETTEPMAEAEKTELKEKLKAAIKKVETKTMSPSSSDLIGISSETVETDPLVKPKDNEIFVKALTIKPTKKPAYTPKPVVKKQEVNLDPSIRPVAKAPVKKRHYIQLASLRDEAQARAAYNKIRADFPKLVEGLSVSFPKADLGSRGTFTRIQIGPLDSESEARKRCANYNSTRGATCLVLSR